MAFPLETGRLLAQLRTWYAAFDDVDGYALRIIRPVDGVDEHFEPTNFNGNSYGLSQLPPITFNVAGHVRKNLNNQGALGHHRRKSLNIKKRRRRAVKSDEFVELDTAAVLELLSPESPTKPKKNIITTPAIVKFFKKSDDSDSDSARSLSALQLTNLDLIQEEDKTDDGDITEKEHERAEKHSIDSDFGVPVDKSGKPVTYVTPSITDDEDEYDDEDEDDFAEDEEEEFDDSEMEFTADSSLDSAFTDIESDPTLDSSMLLNSYDSPPNAYLQNPPAYMVDSSKKQRKKRGSNSFDNYSRILTSTNLRHESFSQTSLNSEATKTIPTVKSFTSLKKTTIVFDKINPKNDKKPSNLSSMINSKFQSIHKNPLNYYLFANSDITDSKVKKVKITIFIQGKQVLKDIDINNNIVVSDCVGYILLCLTKEAGFADISINPNHWRLELADEDGEEYGEFGVLNRTRTFSSYNNPKYLALSKAKEEEIAANEAQTPLSMEFKVNLAQYTNRRNSALAAGKFEDRIDLSIKVPNSKSKLTYTTTPNATIGQVLQEFCAREGLESDKYILKEATDPSKHQKVRSLLLPNKPTTMLLLETSFVGELTSNSLILFPVNGKLVPLRQDNDSPLTIDAQITPSDSTFVIEDKLKKQIKDTEPKDGFKTVVQGPEKSLSIHAQLKRQIDSTKYLEDIMKGENGDLPTNLNSIYFKWKVWRKKPAIINKIERSFTIDGDYIWLTPPDDIYSKNNVTDNLFDNHFSHHHRHHFNNLYKLQQLLKTISFHITQIVKVKQYKNSKNPKLFRIVIKKQGDNANGSNSKEEVKKKYYLEAETIQQCEDIIEKLSWTSQVYKLSIISR